MELSLFLAQLMGIVLVVVGLALLTRAKYYSKVYKAFMKDEGLMFLTALVILVVGVTLVLTHNIWVASWEVIITIVGWGALIKGVLFLFLSREMEKLVESLMKKTWLLMLGGGIWTIAGAVLIYYGWFA